VVSVVEVLEEGVGAHELAGGPVPAGVSEVEVAEDLEVVVAGVDELEDVGCEGRGVVVELSHADDGAHGGYLGGGGGEVPSEVLDGPGGMDVVVEDERGDLPRDEHVLFIVKVFIR